MELTTNMNDVLGDGMSRIELIQYTGTDKVVVNAARVSYAQDNKKSFTERDKKLLNYLLEHEHTSVLEHTYVTFKVEAPLYIAVQWLRHRMSSFNMVSRRYVELGDDYFYTPKVHRLQHENNKQASYTPIAGDDVETPDLGTMRFEDWNDEINSVYTAAYRDALSHYKLLLKFGVARESARAVLPVGQYTQFYYSANLRSMLHFCDLRLGSGAQWEIQEYAKVIIDVLRGLYPNTIEAWESLRLKEEAEKENSETVKELSTRVLEMNKTLQSLNSQLDELRLDTQSDLG